MNIGASLNCSARLEPVAKESEELSVCVCVCVLVSILSVLMCMLIHFCVILCSSRGGGCVWLVKCHKCDDGGVGERSLTDAQRGGNVG